MDSDLAALILRLALGPMLIAHGWNKVAGSGGLAGTAGWFRGLGFRAPAVQARIAAATEVGAGALLTLGALTQLTCMTFAALMTVATLTDHRGKGYFVFRGGAEYTILVSLVAVALAALGPGDWSLDAEWSPLMLPAGWAGAGLAFAGYLLGSAFVAAVVRCPSGTD